MNRHITLSHLGVLVVGLLAASSASARTDVCYAGGATLPNFTLNGSAALGVQTHDLLVTPSEQSQLGSVFYNAPFSSAGDLHVHFRVKITLPFGGGADGMAFVMTSASTGAASLGTAGEGIGYGGLSPSVAVELDTYQNGYDPDSNHAAITVGGQSDHTHASNMGLPLVSLGALPSPVDLKKQPVDVWVDYLGASHTLRVFVATSSTKPPAPLMETTAIDVPTVLGPTFYMGFTASTGFFGEQHEIVALYASDGGEPGDACCTPPGGVECTQGPGALLGPVCDPQKRTCGACSFTNTATCQAMASGCDALQAQNLCTTACGGDFGSGKANACPGKALPFCSLTGPTAGSCVACDGDFGTVTASFPCPSLGAPTCLGTGTCGLCRSDSDCADGLGLHHAGKRCDVTTGSCGDFGTPCFADAECDPGFWCQTVEGTCTSRLDHGQPLPVVAGHDPALDGTCTAQAALVVCSSGVCDASDNRCGYGNGSGAPMMSTPQDQCRSGVVGADGKCGYADGEGTCSATNAATVCRTGVCSGGKCGANNALTGTWELAFDGGTATNIWSSVAWAATLPASTSAKLSFRAATSFGGLAAAPPCGPFITSPADLSTCNFGAKQWLSVTIELAAAPGALVPLVDSLRIFFQPG